MPRAMLINIQNRLEKQKEGNVKTVTLNGRYATALYKIPCQ